MLRTIRNQTASTAGKGRAFCGAGCERTENHDGFGSQLGIWKANHSAGSASKTCRTLRFCGRKNAASKKIKNFFVTISSITPPRIFNHEGPTPLCLRRYIGRRGSVFLFYGRNTNGRYSKSGRCSKHVGIRERLGIFSRALLVFRRLWASAKVCLDQGERSVNTGTPR